MTAFRRLSHNFALQRAVEAARAAAASRSSILEALRCDYRWASDRLHRFVIDGMADNARALAGTPVDYVPYVEPARGAGKGLLAALARDACLVVTDDFPCFFLPRMVGGRGRAVDARLEAVDSNGLLPMRATPNARSSTAFSFRAHVQRHVPRHLAAWPQRDRLRRPAGVAGAAAADVAARWPADAGWRRSTSAAPLLAALPIDHASRRRRLRGGAAARPAALARFVDDALDQVRGRSQPARRRDGTSRLSPYLHFGHISAHEVFAAVMTAERWTTRKLGARAGGKREGWWGVRPGAEAFLDQLVTWRELGFNMCATRPDDYDRIRVAPAWARATLDRHRATAPVRLLARRVRTARTHDPVWNAAQRQLTRDGWMHNYLRMLWGKKILEWTPSPEEALDIMMEIMNKHALDGRDPNSYTRLLLDARPLRSAVGAGAADLRHRALHELRQHGEEAAHEDVPRGLWRLTPAPQSGAARGVGAGPRAIE